jgi:hypothetical protein
MPADKELRFAPGRLDATIIRNPAARQDQTIRPFLKDRRSPLPTVAQIRIMGSAFVAAWPQIVCFTLYGVGVSFLIDFVVEDAHIDVLDASGSFATWALFGVTFFLGAVAFGATNKYAEGIRAAFCSADAIQTAGLYFVGSACRTDMNCLIEIPRYDDHLPAVKPGCPPEPTPKGPPPDDPRLEEVQAIEIFEEVVEMWAAMPFVLKHNFRSDPTTRFDDRIPADVDLTQRGVVVRLLPIRPALIYELERLETDAIGGMLDMIVSRHTLLWKCGLVEAMTTSGIHDQINNIGTQAARVSALQVLGLIPPYKDLLMLGLFIVGLALPWQLWTTFRYFTILFNFIAVFFLYGIYGIGVQVGNPFNRAGSSPFIYHDLGDLARTSARNVHDMGDKFVAEADLYHRKGRKSSPRKAGDSTILIIQEDSSEPGSGARSERLALQTFPKKPEPEGRRARPRNGFDVV